MKKVLEDKPFLESKRLKLRQWQESDLIAFAKLNSDPKVMEFFPNPLDREQSDKLAERLKVNISENAYGFWALELVENNTFIGFVGLNKVEVGTGIPDAPMVEIGWRLDASHWGKGYAPEAAKLALDYAFRELKLDEVYSFTSLLNEPSQRVMQKIGMQNTNQDFDHEKLEEGHRLKRHCLYRISSDDWLLSK